MERSSDIIHLWWFHDIRGGILLSASDGNSFQWRHASALGRSAPSAVETREKRERNHYFVFDDEGDWLGARRALHSYLDMILWMTFFTHWASGSRQTSCPSFFRVALQHQEEEIFFRGSPKLLLTSWDVNPDLGLTWSPSLHSGSWGGWSPPWRCGGRWDGSLFGCSGSAVPLRGSSGSSGSFLLGDMVGLQKKQNKSATQHSNANRAAWPDT